MLWYGGWLRTLIGDMDSYVLLFVCVYAILVCYLLVRCLFVCWSYMPLNLFVYVCVITLKPCNELT